MPLTTIDPRVALILIDLQKGLMGFPTVHPLDDVVQRAAQLARAFRDHHLPVVTLTGTGSPPGRTDRTPPEEASAPPPGWSEVVDELDPRSTDHRITKTTWGGFTATNLHDHLQNRSVTQVVIAGIATSMGVESTARAAHDHGYHVVLATDAMTDLDASAHANSLQRVFPHLGQTTTTLDIIDQLARSG